jgi:hypothetical protein
MNNNIKKAHLARGLCLPANCSILMPKGMAQAATALVTRKFPKPTESRPTSLCTALAILLAPERALSSLVAPQHETFPEAKILAVRHGRRRYIVRFWGKNGSG